MRFNYIFNLYRVLLELADRPYDLHSQLTIATFLSFLPVLLRIHNGNVEACLADLNRFGGLGQAP